MDNQKHTTLLPLPHYMMQPSAMKLRLKKGKVELELASIRKLIRDDNQKVVRLVEKLFEDPTLQEKLASSQEVFSDVESLKTRGAELYEMLDKGGFEQVLKAEMAQIKVLVDSLNEILDDIRNFRINKDSEHNQKARRILKDLKIPETL